jgi:hypothetical protein
MYFQNQKLQKWYVFSMPETIKTHVQMTACMLYAKSMQSRHVNVYEQNMV